MVKSETKHARQVLRLFTKAVEISSSHEKFTRPLTLRVPFATPRLGLFGQEVILVV